MHAMRIFSALLFFIYATLSFAQDISPQKLSSPKIFQIMYGVTIEGKEDTITALIVESRRGIVMLNSKDDGADGNLKIQSYLLPKLGAKNNKAHILHMQIFRQESGKWVLLHEPTIDVHTGVASSLSLEGVSPIKVSVRELTPEQAMESCAKFKGKPFHFTEFQKALERLDAPAPDQVCCRTGCATSGTLNCCWGHFCCSGCGSTCCVPEI